MRHLLHRLQFTDDLILSTCCTKLRYFHGEKYIHGLGYKLKYTDVRLMLRKYGKNHENV